MNKTLELNKRAVFEIKVTDFLERAENMVCYEFKDADGNTLLFETKKAYKDEYDDKFSKHSKISAVVDFINNFNKKVVISGIRFMK